MSFITLADQSRRRWRLARDLVAFGLETMGHVRIDPFDLWQLEGFRVWFTLLWISHQL